MSVIALVSLLALQLASAEPEAACSLGSFTRSETERFLREAVPVDQTSLLVGVTTSDILTLTDGSREARAVWKTINVYVGAQQFEDGRIELGFRDSWKSEVAAYEIDQLLGLDIVPPTVERVMHRRVGSLQLWMEGCLTEAERLRRQLTPLDVEKFNRQMITVRAFHQLIQDADYRNSSNLLFDGRFRLYIIDSSRAFRTRKTLTNTAYLTRFSRALITQLRDLTAEVVKERAGRWLTKKQIESMFQRRDLILDHASELVAQHGEALILYP